MNRVLNNEEWCNVNPNNKNPHLYIYPLTLLIWWMIMRNGLWWWWTYQYVWWWCV